MRPGERDKDFKHANGIFLNKSAKAMDFLGSSSDRGFRTYEPDQFSLQMASGLCFSRTVP